MNDKIIQFVSFGFSTWETHSIILHTNCYCSKERDMINFPALKIYNSWNIAPIWITLKLNKQCRCVIIIIIIMFRELWALEKLIPQTLPLISSMIKIQFWKVYIYWTLIKYFFLFSGHWPFSNFICDTWLAVDYLGKYQKAIQILYLKSGSSDQFGPGIAVGVQCTEGVLRGRRGGGVTCTESR